MHRKMVGLLETERRYILQQADIQQQHGSARTRRLNQTSLMIFLMVLDRSSYVDRLVWAIGRTMHFPVDCTSG